MNSRRFGRPVSGSCIDWCASRSSNALRSIAIDASCASRRKIWRCSSSGRRGSPTYTSSVPSTSPPSLAMIGIDHDRVEVVLDRDRAMLDRAAVARDVADEHRLAGGARRRRTTRRRGRAGVPSSASRKRGGEARRGADAQRRRLGVEQHDGAREPGEVALERGRDREQRLVERHAARDLLEDLGLVAR